MQRNRGNGEVLSELRRLGVGEALLQRFRAVQQPARHDTRYTNALACFVDACIAAWSLGASEDSLHRFPPDASDCADLVAVAWLTLEFAPSVKASNKRLTLSASARSTALSEDTRERWRGFVQLILDGYFSRGHVWQEPSRLAAERELNPHADAESIHTLSERMRVCFFTLNRGCGVPAGF